MVFDVNGYFFEQSIKFVLTCEMNITKFLWW